MASTSRKTGAFLASSAERSSNPHRWKYDVFFSFKKETRKNNLVFSTNRRLEQRGYRTYIDDQMSTEDSISSTTLQAIQESRFAIILLSPSYVSFGCCMEELAKICECMKDENRILPVFYRFVVGDVNPITRSFERAFTKNQNQRQSEKVNQWRDDLKKVGSFSGLSAADYGFIDQSIADAIVESLCTKVTKLQPVVENMDINMGDLNLFEETQSAIEHDQPTKPKSAKHFKATTPATNKNTSKIFVESSREWKHDVFLSFRGEDTRQGFLSHLYDELQNTKGIRTFMDEQQLRRGKDISQSLLTAIEESRFAIIVLSKNYADSAWCLDELTKIVQCMEGRDTILPIFYHVDPSVVRYQNNSYKVALKEHESKGRHDIEKLNQWKTDLTKWEISLDGL